MRLNKKSPTGRVLIETLRNWPGAAVIADLHGNILEANVEGWSFVEKWRYEKGREALTGWLMHLRREFIFTENPSSQLKVQLQGNRNYLLDASMLPTESTNVNQTLFVVRAKEFMDRGTFTLHRLRQIYGLSLLEGEVLAYQVRGNTREQIAEYLDLHPFRIREIEKVLVKKLEAAQEQQPHPRISLQKSRTDF